MFVCASAPEFANGLLTHFPERCGFGGFWRNRNTCKSSSAALHGLRGIKKVNKYGLKPASSKGRTGSNPVPGTGVDLGKP